MKKPRSLSVNKILILIILLALVIRIGVVLSRQAINGDEFAYSRIAEQLASGNGLIDILGRTNTLYFPLLPMLIAGTSFVFNDIVLSGQVVVVLFGCLLLIPAFLLGKELVGERAGLFTAALLAVLPLAVEYSTLIYTESVYTFFMLMGAYFFWRTLHDGSLRHTLTAGMMTGLAYLTNPSGIFYAMAFLVLILIVAVRAGPMRSHFLKAAALFLVVFMVLAFPYVLYLHSHLGKWTYSGKTSSDTIQAASQGIRQFSPEYDRMLSELNDDETDIVDTSKWEITDPISLYFKHPKLFMMVFAYNLNIYYVEQLVNVIPLWLLALLGLGLFGVAWDRSRVKGIGFSLLLILPIILAVGVQFRPRFSMPYVPVIMIWVAVGWQRLEEWGNKTIDLIRGTKKRQLIDRYVPFVIAISVLLPLMVLTAVYAVRQNYNVELRQAGEWLKDNGRSGGNVMDRELGAAFYSGGTAVLFPYADYEKTTKFARLKNVDYLVTDRKALMDFRPGMKALLDDEGRHPDWRLVYGGRAGGDNEVLVFQLLK